MMNSQNPQGIKKGDLVYVKSNKGTEHFDVLIGQTFTVVSDLHLETVSNRDGSLFTGLVVEIQNEFTLKNYGIRGVVSTLDELVKISPPPEKLEEEKELELVN